MPPKTNNIRHIYIYIYKERSQSPQFDNFVPRKEMRT